MVIFIVILVLAALAILAMKGRSGHKGLAALQGVRYAHRGLHGNGLPENSMAAFRAALDHGYGIELDIHLMKDGELAVIHDSSLKRTAGADICIEDLTAAQLSDYRLENTEEKIPLFREVLELFQEKTPLIVELKEHGGNAATLCEAACKLLNQYRCTYCIESFDPRCIIWLKRNRPEIIRGQLTENYFRSKTKLPVILRFVLTHQLENFLTVPDFVSYRCSDRKAFSNTLVRKIWGVQGVTWTLKSQEDYDDAVANGWIPIFEGFRP
jgi:glycerophosphoryl diester phosphodiesterase